MPKPTLVQTLLKRPSQTYSKPERQPENYFSSAESMRQIALSDEIETEQNRTSHSRRIPGHPDSLVDDTRWSRLSFNTYSSYTHSERSFRTDSDTMASKPPAMNSTSTLNSSVAAATRHRDPPPRSRAGVGAANIAPQPSISSVVARKIQPPPPTNRHPQYRQPPRPLYISDDSDDLDGFDSSGEDDFFTPNQSPRTSMASSSILFPSKASSASRGAQPRKTSRRSLRVPTPTQITPNNSISSPPNLPPLPPKSRPSSSGATPTSADNLLQQQNQRVASVNRKPAPTSAGPSNSQAASQHQRNSSHPSKPPSPTLHRHSHTRIHSVPANAKPAAPVLSDSSGSLSRSSSLNRRTASPSSARVPVPPVGSASTRVNFTTSPKPKTASLRSGVIHHPDSQPAERPHPNTVRITSTASSAARHSFSSTSLENHSDIFTNDELADLPTPMTSPVNSGSPATAPLGPNSTASPAAARSKISKATRSTRLPATYHSLSGGIVEPAKRRSGTAHSKPVPPVPQKDYSYTEEDWTKEHKWLVGSIVTGSSESVDYKGKSGGPDKAAAGLSRNESYISKKDKEDRLTLGLARPLSIGVKSIKDKGKGKALPDTNGEMKGRGADKEEHADDKVSTKKKRKSKAEVTYYTATNGTPQTVPPPLHLDGDDFGSRLTTLPMIPAGISPYKMGAIMDDEDDISYRKGVPRLSLISEGEEEPPTPAKPYRNSIATKTSSVNRPKSPLRPHSLDESSLVIVEASDALPDPPPGQHSNDPPGTRMSNWASDYHSIVRDSRSASVENGINHARPYDPRDSEHRPSVMSTFGGGRNGDLSQSNSAYNSAYMSGPSKTNSTVSFAYPSGVPAAATGDPSSNGTLNSLHLARAPPPMFPQQKTFASGLRGILAPSTMGPLHTSSPGMQTLPNGAITRTAIAQTTMTSVEVVRGLGKFFAEPPATPGIAGPSPNKRGFRGILDSIGRRRTVSGGEAQDILERQKKRSFLGRHLSFSGRLRKGSEDATMYSSRAGKSSLVSPKTSDPSQNVAQALATLSTEQVLGLTGYRRPPMNVPSNGVLVQVWAVGVDGIDAKLVGLRLGIAKPSGDDEEPDQGYETERERDGRYAAETEGEETEREDGGQRRGGRGGGLGRNMSFKERLGSLSRRKHSLRAKEKWKRDNERERDDFATPPGEEASTPSPFGRRPSLAASRKGTDPNLPPPPLPQPDIGFIPGRSFVGRVLDSGWDVKDEVVRKGDWVIGLLEPKKCGAMTQFIVVDRHRVRKIPHPASMPGQEATTTATSITSFSSSASRVPRGLSGGPSMTIEEFSLLALTGVPAYRAVRTLIRAFSGLTTATSSRGFDYTPTTSANGTYIGGHNHRTADHETSRQRHALVLRGHDGVGALITQMLVLRGWKVSVHVTGPDSSVSKVPFELEADKFADALQADEIVLDDGGKRWDPYWDEGRAAAARAIDFLREGTMIDAVVDTMGGREIREAAERLLRCPGTEGDSSYIIPRTNPGQFTTLVGDAPDRAIPSGADNFRANFRAMKRTGTVSSLNHGEAMDNSPKSPADAMGPKTKVGYAWIGVAEDVDVDGEGIADTLGHVVRLALEHGIRPVVPRFSAGSQSAMMYKWKGGIIPLEHAPEVFVNGEGPLSNGGTMVVRVAS